MLGNKMSNSKRVLGNKMANTHFVLGNKFYNKPLGRMTGSNIKGKTSDIPSSQMSSNEPIGLARVSFANKKSTLEKH